MKKSKIRTQPKRKLSQSPFFLTFAICILLGLCGCIAHFWSPTVAYLKYEPKEGDLIFQSLPYSKLTATIEGVSGSPYSHCAIVARDPKSRDWIVYEAYNKVEATALRDFIFRGRDYGFSIYRLQTKHEKFISDTLTASRKYLGLDYDLSYAMDDEKIYCSELIWKAFKTASKIELSKTEQLGQLNWRPYIKNIEFFEKGPVPLTREMITPVALAKSPDLDLVYSFRIVTY